MKEIFLSSLTPVRLFQAKQSLLDQGTKETGNCLKKFGQKIIASFVKFGDFADLRPFKWDA